MLPVLFLLLGAAVIPPGQATQTHHHSDSHWHRHAAEAKNAHDDEQQRCNNNPAGPLVPSARETHCPLIIDDETTLSPSSQSNPNPKPPYHPWSYPPLCVHAVDRESEPNKLCTYTVTSLRGGPGLSIITLPIIAAGLSTSLQNPDIPWLEHKRNQPFKPDSNSTPAYEVKEIPGKGLGVVATRDIKKDTIVMLEQPLLLKISDPSPWNHQGALPLMQQAAKRLGKGEQAVLLGLARQGGGRFYILDDIFRTNSFRVQVEGVGHSGIYPSVARINHECKPNCVTRFSAETLAMEVVAYRDIQEGEELSISYIPLNHLSHQRQHLISSWGFTCTCPFCSDTPTNRVTSDRRRDSIEGILQGVRQPENITRDRVHRAVASLGEIVREEGLSAQFGDLLFLIADACLGAGDYGLAREIGEEALKVQRRYAGVDNERSYQVVRLLEILDELEGEGGDDAMVKAGV